jgi:hypothetical protein
MSLYIFSLGAVLLVARGIHHILWASLTPMTRVIFWAVVVALSLNAWMMSVSHIGPFDSPGTAIYVVIGLAGWFAPELFRYGTQLAGQITALQWLIVIALIGFVILAIVDPESLRKLGVIGIICLGIAVVVIKVFLPALKPAPKPTHRKRRRR